ncbi:phage P2 FII-like protein [Novosphingobium sp. Rr 2-17]|uniref:phage major tail tube protein n=1 Tax=Novosphingobium sp. Rr 2-17 TaxID=555793 RepID=UPI00026985A7|nr:phage major tail tube protein [Novosphingobium sp. Rr 2-17]EIZ77779.1 phage P2 FII-like protein [Novosphingobium sp. Rr 2-17]
MGMLRTLKDMMMFNEGLAYRGEAKSVSLPTLSRKMEGTRAAGMSGELQMDMGMEAMELSFTCTGPMRQVLRQWGTTTVDGIYIRFAGNYQSDDTAEIDTVEVIVRGRFKEIEMGDQEVGEASEFKTTMAVAYFKLVWNGRTEIEIDPLNMIEIVDGVDLLAERRNALGLF